MPGVLSAASDIRFRAFRLLYAFPPLELIPQVLARVRVLGVRLLLVAPAWGSWRQDVAPLLYRDPWQLPLRVDLLTQARGEIFHPCPGDLDLWVWPLEGRLSPCLTYHRTS